MITVAICNDRPTRRVAANYDRGRQRVNSGKQPRRPGRTGNDDDKGKQGRHAQLH